jgi:hypothetical protein
MNQGAVDGDLVTASTATERSQTITREVASWHFA